MKGAALVVTLGVANAVVAPAATLESQPGTVATLSYKGGPPITMTVGDLRLTLEAGIHDGKPAVVVHGLDQGHKGFDIDLPVGERGQFDITADVPKVGDPGVAVVTSNTFGNRCCKVSKVVIRTKTRWRDLFAHFVLYAGYRLIDIDRNGKPLLVGVDETFLSGWPQMDIEPVAPIRIEQRVGIRLTDVTRDTRFRSVVEKSLAAMEAAATDVDRHDNGFLADWVTTKVLLGQGQEAWARMLRLYGPGRSYICGLPTSFAHCRKEHGSTAELPALLRRRLMPSGYVPDEKVFALPPTGRDGRPTCRRSAILPAGTGCS